MIVRNNMALALAQARANADWFRVDFVIWTDTSGNLRVDRATNAPPYVPGNMTVVHPQVDYESTKHAIFGDID